MPDIEHDHALTTIDDRRQLVDQITYQLRYEKAEQARISGFVLAGFSVLSFAFAFIVFSLYSAELRDKYNYDMIRLASSDDAIGRAFNALNDIYDTTKNALSGPRETSVTADDGSKNAQVPEEDKDARIEQLAEALRSVQQSSKTVADELSRIPRVIPRKPVVPKFSLSIVSTAMADSSGARALTIRQTTERAPSEKATALANLFWFLLIAPAFACVAGFVCIFQKKKDLVAFGTNLVTSILGYYFGAGVTVLTAMLA